MESHLSALKQRLNSLLLKVHSNALARYDEDIITDQFICCYVLIGTGDKCRLKVITGDKHECNIRDEIIELYKQVRELQTLLADEENMCLFDDYRYVWMDGALKILQLKSVDNFWAHFRTRFDFVCFGWNITADQTIKSLSQREIIEKYQEIFPNCTLRTDEEILEACYTPPHEFHSRFVQVVSETLRILNV